MDLCKQMIQASKDIEDSKSEYQLVTDVYKRQSLISMFTIGIPSFVLALEPNKDLIRGHFLTNVLVRALPAGLTDRCV